MNKKFLSAAVVILAVAVLGGLYLVLDTRDEETAQQNESVATADASPALLQSGLNVDFSQASIDLSKILNGGPGKDGIPALTNPDFVTIDESRINDDTQIIVVQNGDEVKFYPYSILVWHEIVNDDVNGKPLAITFCPLCGSAIVFDRELDNMVVDFGVSGFLYESNMLMYSREDPES